MANTLKTGRKNSKNVEVSIQRWWIGRVHLMFPQPTSKKEQVFKPQVNLASIIPTSIILILIFIFVITRPWAVLVDGRRIAVVRDQRVFLKALEELKARKEIALGKRVSLANHISFHRVFSGNVVSDSHLKEALLHELSFNTRATAIVVNGKVKLTVPDKKTGTQLLRKLKEQYNRKNNTQVTFLEKVEFKDVTVSTEDILNIDQALSMVKYGSQEVQIYQVKEGDTFWDIAAAMHVDIKELQAINPDINPERLQIGQTITISRQMPMINVVTSDLKTIKSEIPFSVDEKQDNSLYRGQYKIIQKGKPGYQEVTYEITCINGIEEKRRVVSQKILEPPKNQVVIKGTRPLLASRSGGAGRLAWPAAGPIVSPFGNRCGHFHAGIDIGAASGSTVGAAESGQVIQAGWNGNYGKCIDINHGSGVVTRYAHLSSINVQVGEYVSRGEPIGRVGTTGNASGPHLHFEVLVNGEPLNPVQFL